MSSNEKSDTTKTQKSLANEIQSTVDKETGQGFRGVEVDPTPNENYTVAGVTAGKPTPETDAGLAKDVRQETGLGLSALEASEREKAQQAKGAKKRGDK